MEDSVDSNAGGGMVHRGSQRTKAKLLEEQEDVRNEVYVPSLSPKPGS